MTNRELKNIIEDYIEKESMTLTQFALNAKVNRSHLSTTMNDIPSKRVSSRLYNKLHKKFPILFPVNGQQNQQSSAKGTQDSQPGNIDIFVEEPQDPYSKTQSPDFLAGKLSGKDELLEEKEKRRKEAEERAKRAEEQNDRLMALLESNLNMLHTEVRVGLAYQKAWVEYEAEKVGKGNEAKQQEVLDKMNRLVRSKIKVDPKRDNAASGHS